MKSKYKFNKYTYFYTNGNKALLVNFCNGTKIILEDSRDIDYILNIYQKKNIPFSDSNIFINLIRNGFILNDNVNEEEFIISNYCKNNTDILEFLIYVTNDCNFKCKYCPQIHEKKYMDFETLNEVCEGIISSLKNEKKVKKLSVSWFGGEPLLNLKNIVVSSNKLMAFCQENGIFYSSGMTTNGFLLTKQVFIDLYNVGIKNYQITIDGSEESHNVTRPLFNGKKTWKTIIDNLRDISSLNFDFYITIRLNVSQNNIDDMTDFISYISNTFDKRFTINIMPISRMGNENSNFHYCGKIESQLVQIYLYKYMINQNINVDFLDKMFIPTMFVCNSGRPNYFAINCEKKVYKCELNVNNDKYCIGYIAKDGLYIDNYQNCSYSTPSLKLRCTSCFLYALCLGISCPLRKVNDSPCLLKKDYLINDYMDVILMYYEKKLYNL